MSYLRYLCLLGHRVVEQIYCCVFFALCTLCCQFPCIVHFVLPLRYSLPFKYPRLFIFDCPFGILYRLYILDCSSLIVPSVFSTVYILLVLLVTNVSVFKLLYLYCYVLEHVSCTCYVTTAFSKSVNAAMCTISVKFVTYLVDTCMTM
jgi:hypothetical protein